MVYRPLLIIALGPTGSGKGSIPDKVSKILKRQITFEKILIDDLVENHPFYKKQIKRIVKKSNNINTIINNKKYIEQFNKAYFKTRKDIHCNTKKANAGKIISCDKQNDTKLKNAIYNKKNIVFESTGEYFPQWLFDTYKKKLNKYDIILAWSVVSLCELINRNNNRVKMSLKPFIKSVKDKSPELPTGPRLPDMDFNSFKSKIKLIQKTFIDTAQKCIHPKCNFRILVFNNETRKEPEKALIYDSIKYNKKNIISANKKYRTNISSCSKRGYIRKKNYKFTKKRNKRHNKKRKTRKKI